MAEITTKPSVAIIGCGRIGRVLSQAFIEMDYPLLGVVSRSGKANRQLADQGVSVLNEISDLPVDLDFVVICVRDDQIEGVVREIADRSGFHRGTVVAHTAGALSAEVLTPLRSLGLSIMSWHPLQTFSGEGGADEFDGVTFGMDGDPEAVEVGERIARDFGGVPFMVPPEMRTLYHLSGVFACNFVAALAGISADLLSNTGMNRDQALNALYPLMLTTLRNIHQNGLPEAITGPVRRGDQQTIRRHLEALNGDNANKEVYRVLSRELVEMLNDPQVKDRLGDLLK